MAGQTEILFDGGVPMIEGTWYNPKTGKSITVRDTMFEDNNLVVMTTDGRRIPYTEMQNYVKSDKPIPKQPKVDPKITKGKKVREELAEPATWDDLILDDDKIFTEPSESILTAGLAKPKNIVEPVSENEKIIERALSKYDDSIDMHIDVFWDAPKDNLKALIDMFGVSEEDIAKYLIKKVKNFNLENPAKEAISRILKK